MQPDASALMEKIGLESPLIGFYDAPEVEPFEPLVVPEPGKWSCLFAYYKQWLCGKTLHITKDNFGCGGAGYHICGVQTRSREDFVRFLADEEGLKSSHALMNEWLDSNKGYMQEHGHILVGPANEDQYEYLKSMTFLVDPDQLSMLALGAQYDSAPGDALPVIAPFGSGCMQLVSCFADLTAPQAIVGATDIAMRQYLPPEILAFTVTKPMFERLCCLDKGSFLYKSFLERLKKARKGKDR